MPTKTLRAYVKAIYTRSGQVSREKAMKLNDIIDVGTGGFVRKELSVALNKHGKWIDVSEGDWIEFEADVSRYGGKTIIVQTRNFRRISNY